MSAAAEVRVFGAVSRLVPVAKAAGTRLERHPRTGEAMVVVALDYGQERVFEARFLADGNVSLLIPALGFRRVNAPAFLAMVRPVVRS